MNPIRDRINLLLILGTILALVVAAYPPDSSGSLSIVASVVGGSLIGLVVSRHYFRQSTEELRTEADKLRRETEDARHYINALISYLEAAGVVRVVRDESGRPIETQIIKMGAAIADISGVFGDMEVRRQDDEDQEQPPERRENT